MSCLRDEAVWFLSVVVSDNFAVQAESQKVDRSVLDRQPEKVNEKGGK